MSSDLTDEELQRIWQSTRRSSKNPLWRARVKILIEEVRRLRKELDAKLSQPRKSSASDDTAIY
ncbi:hypothetical protein Mal4_03410 [Maioricimonas rarisocia]|uniref:Uncharacterized protein n=1 Tax=Maioricimonas rarisocia TaxID=2528026 RepID=A0A517Z0Q5_9PLAN|nr:hypothetical protein [Maioricimonas rarisocia]QDU36058.1 hypothetical protein Mal4_03410 [Maioricimonas rarisocia]